MNDFLIIRLSSLGDIIHTLPAFSALRKKFPQAQITWLVEEKGKEILDLVPGIDRTVIVKPKEQLANLRMVRREIARIKKEITNAEQITLDFQGLIKSGFYAFLSRAKKRIGFHRKNLREPMASLFYTEHLHQISEDIHVIYKNLKLLERVNITDDTMAFPLLLPDELKSKVREILQGLGYDESKKLIILNVGAAWETKRWYEDRWTSLIRKISSPEIFPVLLWGNDTEKKLAQEISQKTETPLVPDLTLQQVMALLNEACLVISGDTFALQAACALSRPVVGIFGPTNPDRNGPFKSDDGVAFHEFDCSYCYKRNCPDMKCLKAITPEEMASLVFAFLEKNA